LLVGRELERRTLVEAIDAVAAGRGGVALIQGEAGIGKTQLVDAVLERVGRQGLRVLRGTGNALESEWPFGLISHALGVGESHDPELTRVRRLISGGERRGKVDDSPGDGKAIRSQIVKEFADMLEHAAEDGPILLVLEDIHWADLETLSVLHRLEGIIVSLPLLLIASMRLLPSSPDLARLVSRLEDGSPGRISLGPLPLEDVATLAAQTVGARPGELLLQQIRGAGGNPLIVVETLAALARNGSITINGGVAESTTGERPGSISRILVRRLEELTTSTIELVRLCSVIGSAFTIDDVSLVLVEKPSDLMPRIEETLRAGILEPSGDRIAFRHDLLRDAVYEGIPESLRKSLHLQAARAFAAGGRQAAIVATHMALGAAVGDVEAVQWLRQAAASAALSPVIAAQLLEKAVALAGPDYADLGSLRAELVVALAWAGRLSEAEELAGKAVGIPAGSETIGLMHLAIAQAAVLRANYLEAARHLDAALECALKPHDRALTLGWLAYVLTPIRRTGRSVDLSREAIELGERVGSRGAIALGKVGLGFDAWYRGDVPALRSLMDEVLAQAEVEYQSPLAATQVVSMCMHAADLDLASEVDRALVLLAAAAERSGPGVSYLRQIASVERLIKNGEWDDAAAEAEAALAVGEAREFSWGWMYLRPSYAQLLVHRGDIVRAEAMLPKESEVVALQGEAGPFLPRIPWSLGLIAEARGDVSRALDLLRSAEGLMVDGPLPVYPFVAIDFIRLAVKSSEDGRVADCLERLDRAADHLGTDSARGTALRARGLVSNDPALLLKAVAVFRLSHRLGDLAAAIEEAGAALAPAPDGIALLEEALGMFDRFGAVHDVARIEALLRKAGVRRGARGRRQRPASGWASLTPTESRVAALVAEGLRNAEIAERLFISKNTLQTHVAHIFAKLGVNSRVELAVSVAAQGQSAV
jgi:DNA-binding CsgD family transcriptional regulator/tetratricopeptide (TPR) repeat protein